YWLFFLLGFGVWIDIGFNLPFGLWIDKFRKYRFWFCASDQHILASIFLSDRYVSASTLNFGLISFEGFISKLVNFDITTLNQRLGL
ncbi:hypothetical protein RhiirA5_444167, partial [Rhizophagus irregularis]